MGHTNTTPNYNLPQFLGSDKPAWLTDVNNAMSAIDTAIAAAKAAADNAGGSAAALATTVGGHTTQLETLSGTVANQGASIVSQGNAINTISSLIGNGEPTTQDKTIIGAINELAGEIGGDTATVRYNNGYIQYTDDGGTTWKNLFPVPSGSAIIPALSSNTSAAATVGSVSGTVDGTGQEVTLANAYKAFGTDGANIQHAHNITFTFNSTHAVSKVSAHLYSESENTVAGSIKLQVSPDGTTWQDVATSTLAGEGSENIEGTYTGYAKAIRIVKSDAAGMVNVKNLQAFG